MWKVLAMFKEAGRRMVLEEAAEALGLGLFVAALGVWMMIVPAVLG